MLNMIGWCRIFLFAFASVLLGFYMSWKFFKSGNTMDTAYLNQTPNPKSRYLTGANVSVMLLDLTTQKIKGRKNYLEISKDGVLHTRNAFVGVSNEALS